MKELNLLAQRIVAFAIGYIVGAYIIAPQLEKLLR